MDLEELKSRYDVSGYKEPDIIIPRKPKSGLVLKHLDLFSGIGGFALAVDAVWGNVEHIFCEIDPFCKALLKKRFEGSIIYDDIRQVTANTHWSRDRTSGDTINGNEQKEVEEQSNFTQPEPCRHNQIDILTGGFPCQPFSQAGKRKGTDDNRYLWPEMLRVIQEFQPTWVVAENVRGLLTINEGLVFEQVCSDLEGEGYEVQPLIIPACAKNAPHRRDRVWFIANRRCELWKQGNGEGVEANQTKRTTCPTDHKRCNKDDTNANGKRLERWSDQNTRQFRLFGGNGSDQGWGWYQNWLEVATQLCGVDDGFPAELDGLKLSKSRHRKERLKALGNAIVPQVAIEIFKAIKFSIKNKN